LRIKKQETHLILLELDDDVDDNVYCWFIKCESVKFSRFYELCNGLLIPRTVFGFLAGQYIVLHWFWSPPNLLSVGNLSTFPDGKRPKLAAGHLPSCSNDLRNA
jgi:hypothetical protein